MRALQLASAEAEPLACVVVEAREAERVVCLLAEKGPRQRAEHAPAAGLLRGEPSEIGIELKGAQIAFDASHLVTERPREDLGRNDLERRHGEGEE